MNGTHYAFVVWHIVDEKTLNLSGTWFWARTTCCGWRTTIWNCNSVSTALFEEVMYQSLAHVIQKESSPPLIFCRNEKTIVLSFGKKMKSTAWTENQYLDNTVYSTVGNKFGAARELSVAVIVEETTLRCNSWIRNNCPTWGCVNEKGPEQVIRHIVSRFPASTKISMSISELSQKTFNANFFSNLHTLYQTLSLFCHVSLATCWTCLR